MCATCVLLVCYVAKFRASVNLSSQQKPLILRYFLEFTSLSCLLDGDCESSKIGDFLSFWVLCGSYIEHPTPAQDKFVTVFNTFSPVRKLYPTVTSALYLGLQKNASSPSKRKQPTKMDLTQVGWIVYLCNTTQSTNYLI